MVIIIRNTIKYQLDRENKTAKVIGYRDEPVEVIIPEFIRYRFRKYKVTSIGNDAFFDCYSLKSIDIPDSVTYIGNYAFFDCWNLKSITIPDSVNEIGNYAFYNCQSLTSIDIPNSITYIRYKAFAHCSSLSSITIPNNVTKIGNWAFYNCSSLTSITIPNGVTSIGESAFDNIGLTLPKRYTNDGKLIAYKAFRTDMTCRNFQYEEGKTYEIEGEIKCCECGFHACINPLHIFNYYWGTIGNKIYINKMYIPSDILIHEVYLSGDIDDDNKVDSKVCGSKIEIGRRLTMKDINNIINYK